MKLPNSERAVIDMDKLVGYCLNTEHDEGGHKARVFQAALGISIDNAEELQAALLYAVQNYDGEIGKCNNYGQKYVINFTMVRLDRKAIIKSIWMVRYNENFPRLVSCYVLPNRGCQDAREN